MPRWLHEHQRPDPDHDRARACRRAARWLARPDARRRSRRPHPLPGARRRRRLGAARCGLGACALRAGPLHLRGRDLRPRPRVRMTAVAAARGDRRARDDGGNGQRAVAPELVASPLLPKGFTVPASRSVHPATRLRRLLETEPYLFGPGVYDPFGAQLVMYHGFKAVYVSRYSFAIGHLGTTDMDLDSGREIADGARRTVSALRKFQLTMAVGDPAKGVEPRILDIPPVVVHMDAGCG